MTAVNINGSTRLYGIVGDPIAQVRSPETYTELFAAAGKNAILIPVHVLPGEFDKTVPDSSVARSAKGKYCAGGVSRCMGREAPDARLPLNWPEQACDPSRSSNCTPIVPSRLRGSCATHFPRAKLPPSRRCPPAST